MTISRWRRKLNDPADFERTYQQAVEKANRTPFQSRLRRRRPLPRTALGFGELFRGQTL